MNQVIEFFKLPKDIHKPDTDTRFPHQCITTCEKCKTQSPSILVSKCNHIICKFCIKKGKCCDYVFTLNDIKISNLPPTHYIASAAMRQNTVILDYILKTTKDKSAFQVVNVEKFSRKWYLDNILN